MLCADTHLLYAGSRVTSRGDKMPSRGVRFIQAIGLTAGFLAPAVVAQFPPTPEGVTVLESKFGNGVKISYKEVREVFF